MKTGYIASPPDHRDYIYGQLAGAAQALPSSFFYDRIPINEQVIGDCVGQSARAIKAIQERKNHPGRNYDFAPDFVYSECKKLDGKPDVEGTYPRTAMAVLKDIGAARKGYYPDLTVHNQRPTASTDAKTDAKQFTIGAYAKIQTIAEIKQALVNEGPVMAGFLVTDESVVNAPDGLVGLPNGSLVGGHAVAIDGYDDNMVRTIRGREYKGFFRFVNSWGCYDEETEVLTKDGFKRFKDVSYDDEFATLSDAGKLEYANPSDIIAYHYKGKMHHYKSSKIDLLVTPNHNMYIKTFERNDPQYKFVKAEDIKTKRFIVKRDAEWEGNDVALFILPGYSHNVNNSDTQVAIEEKEIGMDAFLEFIGYWLSEGSTSKVSCARGGCQYNVSISQLKEHNLPKIEEALKKLPFNYHKTPNGFQISNKQLYLYLQQFGHSENKYIPREFLQLSKRQLKLLFDALMLGDGSITECKNGAYRTTYYTSSKQLTDDFQEICLKLGYASSLYVDDRRGTKNSKGHNYKLIGYQVRIQNFMGEQKKHGEHTVNNDNVTEDYDGNVYCVTVPNHTLFVRRNGKTVWCGNSAWGDKGYGWMAYDFVTFRGDYGMSFFSEAWSSVDVIMPNPNASEVVMWLNSTRALVDGEEVTLEQAPVSPNGRTLVPLRFLAEVLGWRVDWDAVSKKITLRRG